MSSSSASSKLSVNQSTENSFSRSVNGSLQNPSRSKGPAKRSVTPNSRSHYVSSFDCDGHTNAPNRRSVTPISRSHAHHGKDNDPFVVVKTAPAGSKRSATPISSNDSIILHDPEPGRVRVTVRLRPRNAEDLASDADYVDCVELFPELQKLKLKKNNWRSESYKFDEVFTETASQKRIYEVVAKPVVESVLSGYNGTVMAYGQTGTGKTYTVGNLGKDDASERGIMVRAIEDILASTSPDHDTVEFSYLQLYMESVQDLLSPEKINIPIVEDAKTGEVSLPGAEVVNIQELDHFFDCLQKGEANRHAANTKMNTNSSRSHAILMVYIKRSFAGRTIDTGSPTLRTIRKSKLLIVDLAGSERIDKSGSEGHLFEEAKFINLSLTSLGKCINALAENSPHIPTRESKLTRLLRDSFGGSARTSLIITIGPSARNHAETTSTVMFGQRAMKIVNMMKLKEEFDYESLSRKLECQVDHLTKEIDRQQKIRDIHVNKLEKELNECQLSFSDAEKNLVARSEAAEKESTRLMKELEIVTNDLSHQKDCNKLLHAEVSRLEMSIEKFKQKQHEDSTHQKTLIDTTQVYEKQIAELIMQVENERSNRGSAERQLDTMRKQLSDHEKTIQRHQMEHSSCQNMLSDTEQTFQKNIEELTKQMEYEQTHRVLAEKQVESLNKLLSDMKTNQGREQILVSELRTQVEEMERKEKAEVSGLMTKLEEMEQLHQRALKELELLNVKYSELSSEKEKLSYELDTTRDKLLGEEKQRMTLERDLVKSKKLVGENNEDAGGKRMFVKQQLSRGSSSFRSVMGLPKMISSQRAALAQFCEDVGLEKIVSLLSSDDVNAQMYAIKVVANLAADDLNLDKIVNDGGLEALLKILETSRNITILRVACGAIANLAMNETNQAMIMSKKGSKLLASTAARTDDPQTLRMVAGAIANLSGNVKLHMTLNQDGCIKALLGMARSKNSDVVAQVARALSNIAKSEPRGTLLGHRRGRSLLMEEGAFTWLVENSNVHSSDSSQRHIELALCHLAQVEDNIQDFISAGGLKELVAISSQSAREDIRNLATNTLKLNPTLETQLAGAVIS